MNAAIQHDPHQKTLVMQPKKIELGKCPKCDRFLSTAERAKTAKRPDGTEVKLGRDGRPVPLQANGEIAAPVATEWRVCCIFCDIDYPQHPYQQTLNEQMAEAATRPAPPPPVFVRREDTFAGHLERQADIQGRLTQLESDVAALKQLLADLHRQLAETQDALRLAAAGKRNK